MRETLRETLDDAKVFMAQIPKGAPREGPQSFQKTQHSTCITFSPKDMQVKPKHDRPLYFTGYWTTGS